MILPFSTHLNGKPTYFIEKIWTGLRPLEISEFIVRLSEDRDELAPLWLSENFKPKIHTIREDKNNRWKQGMMIDFFINSRTKDMFRFAPRIPVVSTQEIKIIHSKFDGDKGLDKGSWIFIDDVELGHDNWYHQLAVNDGFNGIEDFFNYFNEDFAGKIIHWTDFKYLK